jgi:hypothetical protein
MQLQRDYIKILNKDQLYTKKELKFKEVWRKRELKMKKLKLNN